MISKKLLSEVLGVDLSNSNNMLDPIPQGQERGSNTIFYWLPSEDRFHSGSSINIYELAHKCKEWVSRQSYHMQTNLYLDGLYRVTITFKGMYDKEVFDEGTEYEAIFKACEWILNDRR